MNDWESVKEVQAFAVEQMLCICIHNVSWFLFQSY